MPRLLWYGFFFVVLAVGAARADDDSPPISITSPDTGSTFAYGTIKARSLFWSKREQMLFARVTFADDHEDNDSPQDDTLQFRLPGVRFDAQREMFFATSSKGEAIPVARVKKTLFLQSIEVLANARVRVIHNHGFVSVILEAISPHDPAMRPAPENPDGESAVDAGKN